MMMLERIGWWWSLGALVGGTAAWLYCLTVLT